MNASTHTPAPEREHEPDVEEMTGERGSDLSRILGLSDGVFGFALTLLASGIGIPAFARGINSAQLTQEIIAILPDFLVYAATFYFIVIKWTAHRHIFAVVVAYDEKLIWLNNLFLLMIAFMPVPSKILVEYPSEVAAVVFFAAAHVLTTLVQEVLWVYVTHTPQLVRPGLDADYVRASNLGNVVLIVVFTLSIAVAIFIGPGAATLSWLLPAVVSILASRRAKQRKVRCAHPHPTQTAESARSRSVDDMS